MTIPKVGDSFPRYQEKVDAIRERAEREHCQVSQTRMNTEQGRYATGSTNTYYDANGKVIGRQIVEPRVIFINGRPQTTKYYIIHDGANWYSTYDRKGKVTAFRVGDYFVQDRHGDGDISEGDITMLEHTATRKTEVVAPPKTSKPSKPATPNHEGALAKEEQPADQTTNAESAILISDTKSEEEGSQEEIVQPNYEEIPDPLLGVRFGTLSEIRDQYKAGADRTETVVNEDKKRGFKEKITRYYKGDKLSTITEIYKNGRPTQVVARDDKFMRNLLDIRKSDRFTHIQTVPPHVPRFANDLNNDGEVNQGESGGFPLIKFK